jgi:rubrerythrin
MEDGKAKQLTKMELVNLLVRNNQEEQAAIAGYTSLLARIELGGITGANQNKEVIETINEIIADEMNHSQKLANLVTQISGIQPAAQ